MPDEFDDLVRAVAENDVVARDVQLCGERVAEIKKASAVRVEFASASVAPVASTARGEGPSGFSFEASLMDLVRTQARFARGLLDRLARFVESEIAQVRVGVIPDGGHAALNHRGHGVHRESIYFKKSLCTLCLCG